MLKKLTVALVPALAGCAGGPAVLNQAQAVPMQPAPAPLPFFPQPRHTPAGAGASPLGMPWQAPESQVERSPNRRVLPSDAKADREPGIWAADEVKKSTPKYPTVADVELPLPASDDSNLEAPFCAHNIERLLKSEGQLRQLMDLSFDDRRCLVARLNVYCWDKALATATSRERRDRIEGAMDELQNFLSYACRNTRPGKRHSEKIWNAVTSVWDIASKSKGKRR